MYLQALVCLLLPILAVGSKYQSASARNLTNIGLSPETQIFYSIDPSFETQIGQRYTVHDRPTYLQSVKPAKESDVQKIVKYASQNNIPFLTTGGGHGFATTLGQLKSGLQIDMSGFKNISIDKLASTMTIGPGVLMGEVLGPLYDAGKEMQTGSEKCVGLLGGTLGGGVGRLNGLHGLMVDALLSVRIVTARGRVVTASKTENSDLFWGIRGAGFQFGIVTSATYQVYELTNGGQMMNADFLFPLNETTALFEYFRSMENTQPAELALILQTGYQAELGGQYVVVNAVYYGPLENGRALVQPLIDAHPLLQNITMISQRDLLSSAFFGAAGQQSSPCSKNNRRDVFGLGLKTIQVPTFSDFFANFSGIFATYPGLRESVFFLEAFPMQAARAVPDQKTAYPHRDINYHLLFNYGYSDDLNLDTVDAFAISARGQFAATSGFDGIKTYVSYGHGDESPQALYGARKLPRLKLLKSLWDPMGLFSFNQPF